MHEIHVHDRYAQTPPDSWIGRRWQSTRRLACGCWMTGIITALKPGAVRIEWSQCLHWPDSWEPTDRGVLARA